MDRDLEFIKPFELRIHHQVSTVPKALSGNMDKTQMLLKCCPVWPLYRPKNPSENVLPKCSCMLKHLLATFVLQFDVSQFGHNVGQQFNLISQIPEVIMRSVVVRSAPVHNSNQMAARSFEVWLSKVVSLFGDNAARSVEVSPWIVLYSFSSSPCIHIHVYIQFPALVQDWITLGFPVFESMPWFCSSFSNFYLHLVSGFQ